MTLGKSFVPKDQLIPAWACFPVTGSSQDVGAVYTLRSKEVQVRLALGLQLFLSALEIPDTSDVAWFTC